MPPACVEWQQKLHAKLHVKDKFKTSEGEKWSAFGVEFKHLSISFDNQKRQETFAKTVGEKPNTSVMN